MSAPEPRTKSRILVVDDDVDYLASVTSLLESQGYEVVTAESGKEGLRKLVEHRPDALILDIMMESASEGYGPNQAIKYQDEYAAFRAIPIIMASSIQQSPDELFPRAGELEMIRPDYYFAKPLDIPKFLDVVRRATTRR